MYLIDYDRRYDPQQAEPAGWCPNCGMEIWEPGQELCTRCRRMEEDDAETL